MSQFESPFEEKFYRERRVKLAQMAALGQQPYPNSFRFTHTLAASIEGVPALLPLGRHPDGSPKSAEELEASPVEAAVAGRLVAIRLQGKAGFATLLQGGARLQIYVRRDDVGEPAFELYKLLDLGDHVGVRGTLMRTRTGELTLKLQDLAEGPAAGPALTLLTKAMLPLPDKFSGLGDIELRYRRRYLDLFTDTGEAAEISATEGAAPPPTRLPAREVFVKRAAVLRALRSFFDRRGYLEVETPMLHTIAGGAAARTFTTHHNAEDMELTLRIAPELHLKRLVVGGLDRVYEINRNFRNEGIDRTHNPEFTMLEFYQAYANYEDLMDLTEELIKDVAMEVNGTTKTRFNDVEIELSQWTKLSMREAISKWWPPEAMPSPSEADFQDVASFHSAMTRASDAFGIQSGGVYEFSSEKKTVGSKMSAFSRMAGELYLAMGQVPSSVGGYEKNYAVHQMGLKNLLGKCIAETFELLAEEHLIQPTLIYDFPLAVSPLSKVKPDEPDWVERFEFYIGGMEIGNAFSELNDPEDQRNRFLAQVADKDPESMAAVDEDYVRALGYGLPPTAGEGIGIDRLTMVLTGSRTIRDVVLFPLMRPQREAEDAETPRSEPTEG